MTSVLPASSSVKAGADDAPNEPAVGRLETGGPMGIREQWAYLAFSTLSVIGLFLDGWAHNHDKPETFFTPWHAVLYSGFVLGAVYFAYESRRQARTGEVREPVAGDRATQIGLVLFGVGMVGDFLWHAVFGIEQGIDALFSPTHLSLMTGGLLLMSAPFRAAVGSREDSAQLPDATWPIVVSVTISAALVGFFLQFAATFRDAVVSPTVVLAGRSGYPERMMVLGVMSVLLTSLIFMTAAALLLRFRTRPGMLTVCFTGIALLLSGLDSFDRGPIVLAAVLGGLVGDALAHRGRIDLVLPVASGVLWLNWFGLVALTGPMAWNQNVWLGTVYLTVVEAVVLTLLASLRRTDRGLPSAV